MSVYIAEPREPDGRRQLAVSGAFILLALMLNVLPPGGQRWSSGVVRSTVLAPFLWTQERVVRARVQATQAVDLQARLDSLTRTLISLESLAEENGRLRALLGLQAREAGAVVAASIIRPRTPGSESVFLLDKGRNAGIAPGDPILVGDGLLGLVRQVDDDGAIGIDWTNPDFRVGAMTEDGLTYGIVEPVAGSFREDDRLLFNGAPYSSDIPVGTPIVASGRGGVYPRGIRIGVVDTVAEADAGWRKSYWLRPAVMPAAVTHALVPLSGGFPSIEDGEDFEFLIDSLLLEMDLPRMDTGSGLDALPPPPDR